MTDYNNDFEILNSLPKFQEILSKIFNVNQEYCKLLIDPDEIDKAVDCFKNQEYRVIEITKSVNSFLEECKEFKLTLNFQGTLQDFLNEAICIVFR